MKTSNRKNLSSVLVALAIPAFAAPLLTSCDPFRPEETLSPTVTTASVAPLTVDPQPVARMLADLPLTLDDVREVHEGVNASAGEGYDEEVMFRDLLSDPGSSIGRMVSDEAESSLATRASGFISGLEESRLQIYWPYSENWDGKTLPVITFRPEVELAGNIGFAREELPDGTWIVKEMMVDEEYAVSHPVWVVNYNEDDGMMTPQKLAKLHPETATRASSGFRTLKLKEFKAHRQYDNWLAGGSEFFIKCGSLEAFTADVISDLSRFSPEITDLMIKVKRGQVGKALRYNAIIVSEWSSQLTESVFMITEDDGGKVTTWKSTGKVMIKSKAYGYEVEIPYHRNDDIVWRGKLSSNYFENYNGRSGRFGDVSVTFVFD